MNGKRKPVPYSQRLEGAVKIFSVLKQGITIGTRVLFWGKDDASKRTQWCIGPSSARVTGNWFWILIEHESPVHGLHFVLIALSDLFS